jgi:hypothetical protein
MTTNLFEDHDQPNSSPQNSRWSSWCLRADPWPLLLAALLAMVTAFWQYRLPQSAMYALVYVATFVLGVAFLTLLTLTRGLQGGLRTYYERRVNVHGDLRQANRRFWSWLLIIVIATSVSIWARLPLEVGFLISRPALNQIADEALAHPDQLIQLTGRCLRWIQSLRFRASSNSIGRQHSQRRTAP